MDNLIKVNNNNSIIIKCKTLYLKNDSKCSFDEPFPNKCLGVFLTDYSTTNTAIYSHAVDEIDKTGFKFLTTFTSFDTVYYLAIGY